MTHEKNYFKSFCKLSAAFGTAATKDQLLDLIVESAIASMDGRAACLFLSDRKHDLFYPVAQSGLSDAYLHANPLKAQKIVKALGQKGHLAFVDATTDPRLENHAAKQAEGIASILTVPVTVKNRTIGVLSLYTAVQREFQSEDIEFLRALAEQGGIAITHARLLERINRNAMLFLELAGRINSTLDIPKVLDYLTVKVCESMEMKGAVIRLLDEDNHKLKLVASHGVSQKFLETCRDSLNETAKLALEGQTLIINDTDTDQRLQFRDALKAEGILSMIVTPILAKNRIVGVLRLYSDSQRDFPEDMILMVKALAHQGGLAIQNASMYLQLQEDKKSLEEDVWSHRAWF